jgi:hypothetical protein
VETDEGQEARRALPPLPDSASLLQVHRTPVEIPIEFKALLKSVLGF